MQDWQQLFTERPDGANLETFVSETQGPLLIFTPGATSKIQDYASLLTPLTKKFNVVAYNHAGHCQSTGRFQPENLGQDTDALASRFSDGYVYHVSHSAGVRGLVGTQTTIKAATAINPFMYGSFFRPLYRRSLKLISKNFLGMHSLIEPAWKILDENNNRTPLQDVLALSNMRKPVYVDTSLLAYIADSDEVLGTGDKKQYRNIVNQLDASVQGLEVVAVPGLNHCLNKTPRDLVPFMKGHTEEQAVHLVNTFTHFLLSSS